MRKKQNKEWPMATIGLSFLLIAFYFLISGGTAYITPLSRMYALGISGYTPFGVFTYFFMHIGIKHLIGNLVAFIAFGVVLERVVRKIHVVAIFLLSGLFAGGIYALLHPDVWVVGASAAAAGILVAGFIADPKKMILVFIAVMLLVPNVVLPLTDGLLNELEKQKHVTATQTKIDLDAINESITNGDYDKDTLKEKQLLEEEYLQSISSKESLSQGRETESTTPASFEIHVIGGLVAALFMWMFNRKICRKFGREIRALI